MNAIVKIYLLTPTEEGGVAEYDTLPSRYVPGSYVAVTGWLNFLACDEGKIWFLDRNKALTTAEAERVKRIASLKRKIEKLEKIGPFVDLGSAS